MRALLTFAFLSLVFALPGRSAAEAAKQTATTNAQAPEENKGASRWFLRIAPGFGYMWDLADTPCPVNARTFNGAFHGGATVRRDLVLAGSLLAAYNNPPISPECSADGLEGNEFLMMAGIGGSLHWFPDPSGGWHANVAVGFAGLDRDGAAEGSSRGVFASLSTGHDWPVGTGLRLGVMAEGITFQTWNEEHAGLIAALKVTIAFPQVLLPP